MTEPRDDRTHDLKALRNWIALNVGELETVAARWEEASRDPKLERILTAFADALFVETSQVNEETGTEHAAGALSKPVRATR